MTQPSKFYIGLCVAALLANIVLLSAYKASASFGQAVPLHERATLEYHLMAGDMAWQRGLWQDAAEHYLYVAQRNSQTHFAALATSAALQADALAIASEAAHIWANLALDDPQAQALSTTLLIKQARLDLALVHLDALLTYNAPHALMYLFQISQSLPTQAQGHAFLVLLEQLSADYPLQANVWFMLARQAQLQQNPALALTAIDQALIMRPDWTAAIALRVQVLYQTQAKQQAIDYLSEVLVQHPNNADLAFIQAQIAREIQ